MKVALINVQIIDGNNLVPPMGVLSIAAALEKSGYDVKVIDRDPEYYNIADEIKKFNPDMIGLGFLTTSYKRALDLTKRLMKEIPNPVYFCGGVHTTIEPMDVLKNFGVDFVVVGEGEITTVEALNKISEGKSLHGVKGVIYKNKGKVINNSLREPIKDLDTIPFIARHLINFEKEYLTFPGVIRGKWCKSTTMMASRGCPYHCIYCNSHTVFGRNVRRRSIDNVIAEIEYLKEKYDVEGIYFVDDTFTLDKEWVIKFCQELKRKGINILWGCQARVNTVDKALLEGMKAAGCIQLDYGVESGSEKILKVLKKGTTPEMIKNAFRLTKEVGLGTLATFMVGNPYETKEDIEKTLRLAKAINADYTTFFFTTPFPGTELWDMAVKNRWIDQKKTFSDAWIYRQSELPIMNINFSKEELAKIRGRLQNHFFMRNYLHTSNLKMGAYMLFLCIKHPKTVAEGISDFFKGKRMDSFLESVLRQHRFNLSLEVEKASHYTKDKQ